MKTVYLGLGANLGKREETLQLALDALAARGVGVKRISAVYETAPREYLQQPWFLNLVAEAETDLLPMRLLQCCQQIERALGRRRTLMEKGPRIIDIDILLHGRAIVDTPQLVIPHPSLHERRFVLEPLAELAPQLKHPVLNKSMRDLLAATTGQQVRKADIVLNIAGI